MRQTEQGWDTRAWLVGILGGLSGGSVMAWVNDPFSWGHANVAAHVANADHWMPEVAICLNLLVLPGLLSGVAQRRTFLWGLLPVSLSLAVLIAYSQIVNGFGLPAKIYGEILLFAGLGLVLSSGPVSLFRWLRARRQREAAMAFPQFQHESASVPREGVWPPPPDYRP